ncbi:MAG: hypothetical protein P1U63_09210 [Coxiellaceae bacterium]|nr:hypothetical protein [Coxiellaceae bacterium]
MSREFFVPTKADEEKKPVETIGSSSNHQVSHSDPWVYLTRTDHKKGDFGGVKLRFNINLAKLTKGEQRDVEANILNLLRHCFKSDNPCYRIIERVKYLKCFDPKYPGPILRLSDDSFTKSGEYTIYLKKDFDKTLLPKLAIKLQQHLDSFHIGPHDAMTRDIPFFETGNVSFRIDRMADRTVVRSDLLRTNAKTGRTNEAVVEAYDNCMKDMNDYNSAFKLPIRDVELDKIHKLMLRGFKLVAASHFDVNASNPDHTTPPRVEINKVYQYLGQHIQVIAQELRECQRLGLDDEQNSDCMKTPIATIQNSLQLIDSPELSASVSDILTSIKPDWQSDCEEHDGPMLGR